MKGHPELSRKSETNLGLCRPCLKKRRGGGGEKDKSEELEPVFRRLMRGFSLNCRTRPFQRVGLALVFQRSSLPIELLLSIR